MSSIPTPFTVGSSMSTSSVRDVIASYRRAQYLVAGSTIAATPAAETNPCEDEDKESSFERFDEYEEDECSSNGDTEDRTPRDGFLNQLVWDEDLVSPDSAVVGTMQQQVPASTPVSVPRTSQSRRNGRDDGLTPLPSLLPSFGARRAVQPQETTPLLSRKISFDVPPQLPHRLSAATKHGEQEHLHLDFHSSHQRRISNGSIAKSVRTVKGVKPAHVGRSTFGQTLFNSIAILLGIGMLSEPLAFAYSGWIMGTILIISYGALACYTAKILAHIICADPRLRSYSDIGRKAFGPRATLIISLMFCMELFAVGVILVTLYADSLHTIMPTYSANSYKIWGLLVIVPTVFLPLSLLSYTSIIGIISIVLLIVVIFIDGVSKQEAPGSFWDPAETSIGVASMEKLGIAFGLFMAGFAGHAVVPSLARDMIDPSQFDTMINWAFVVATFIYALIGYAGYLMYGNSVSDEISMDMLKTPGYNPLLNQAALWMLVLSPLSKFALNTQPLNATLDVLLGLDTPIFTPEHVAKKPNSIGASECRGGRVATKQYLSIIQRLVVTCASVAISIYIPEFSIMMAFLGSFSAFCISIVGPIAAKVKMEGKCGVLDGAIMFLGTVMAIWGTLAAFLSSD